jgi:RHS repeat-associated protein
LEIAHQKKATAKFILGLYGDHLGTIRPSYADDNGNPSVNSFEILSEKYYYPFGVTHKGYGAANSSMASSAALKFKYNGKELNDELGLGWYDFGARNYDASIVRWMNLDPLAEKYYSESTYNYTLNSPVFFTDPDGREVDVTQLVNSDRDNDKWLLTNLMISFLEISGGMTISFFYRR